jgi:hypothetical protein
MSNGSTDICDFRQQPRRRNRAAIGEALHEKRKRAAVTARRLPDATEHRHAFPAPSAPLLNEDQLRRRAAYSLPPAELKARAVEKLRAEISPAVNSLAKSYRLTLLAARVAEQIYRTQKAANGWTQLSAASIAQALNANPASGPNAITPDMVRDIITALTKLGALNEKPGFGPGVQGSFKVAI